MVAYHKFILGRIQIQQGIVRVTIAIVVNADISGNALTNS